MNKNKYIFPITIFVLLLTFIFTGCENKKDEFSSYIDQMQTSQFVDDTLPIRAKISIKPDKTAILNRIHTKQMELAIKLDSGKSTNRSLYDYLTKLNTKELLEIAGEFSEDGRLERTGLVLLPHFKKKWEGKVPLTEIREMVLDKTYSPKFRAFLMDITPRIASLTTQENVQFEESILAVAKNKDNDPNLRRYALLQMRGKSNLQIQIPKKGQTSKQVEKLSSELLTIFNDSNSPSKVKGASITAMRRKGDPTFEKTVINILSNPSQYSDIVIRHAVVSAAKSKSVKELLPQIENIARSTDSPEVYASSMYALGIIGNTDAIVALVSVFGRHGNERIGGAALRKNQRTMMLMLDPDQPADLIETGLAAVRLSTVQGVKKNLQKLTTSGPTEEIRFKAAEIIKELYKKENSTDEKLLNKWDAD
jgi:hypothetical protein